MAQLVSQLEAARRLWVEFDLEGHLASFQETLGQAREAREQSLVARKLLAETTKQFKKTVKGLEQAVAAPGGSDNSNSSSSSSNVTSSVDSLGRLSRSVVKAYQEEVDQLTRRCKGMEAAHQSLGTDLSRVADPAPVLQLSVEHIATLARTVDRMARELEAAKAAAASAGSGSSSAFVAGTGSGGSSSAAAGSAGLSKEEREELVQLRREVAEYEVEFRSLKNQDITIRKLEAKILDLQTSAQESLSSQLEQAKQELAETEGRRAAEALEREAAMERKVQTLELQLRAERAGREATHAHLLQADEGVSQREAAWEAQKRILVDDSERLREQLQIVTAERDELSMRVAASLNQKSPSSGGGSSAFTPPASGGVTVTDLMLERKAYEAEVRAILSINADAAIALVISNSASNFLFRRWQSCRKRQRCSAMS
jgi:homeobox protein cut-like